MFSFNRFSFTISTFVVIIFLLTAPLYATTINVPNDQPTIQAGIDAAVDGDTVLVQTQLYAGEGVPPRILFSLHQDCIA